MPKYAVDVWFKGCARVEVEAEGPDEASEEACLQYGASQIGDILYLQVENSGDVELLEEKQDAGPK